MAAFVTDKFRIINTSNFVNSISSGDDNYFIFVGLPNPNTPGFGRDEYWESPDLWLSRY